MRRFLPVLVLVVSACKGGGDPAPKEPRFDTLPTAQRLAEEGMARWPSDNLALSWIETVWHFGLYQVADSERRSGDGDTHTEDAIDTWLTRGLGFFEGTDPREFNSSDGMSPATLASVRLAAGSEVDASPIVDEAWDYLNNRAYRTSQGAIAHWGDGHLADTDEVWVDSQFMFGMFLLAEYDRTGDRAILEQFVEQYELFSELCRDPDDQLYRHAYKDSTGENIPTDAVYWARGNSWVLISAAELLDRVGADDPLAERVAPLFEAHVDAVVALQAEDGLWHTVLNSPRGEDPANYTETSGSALIAYALVRGMEGRAELDPVEYGRVVGRAIEGIDGRLTEDDGALHLSGTSFGTNPGDYDYYLAVPQLDDQVLGVGSVLMLYARAHNHDTGFEE